MAQTLAGQTIALAEGRQLEELAQMLEREGANTVRCPMVSILDAPDPAPVLAWLNELIAGRFDYVVLMTGEALRRLLGFAERATIKVEVVAALGRTQTVTRGPKPVRALKDVGLNATLIAEMPTTEGVIATLRTVPLAGKTVGLTLFGAPNPPLEQFLADSGAIVHTVLPYVYAPAADADRIVELVKGLSAGTIHAIIFTSSPQVDRLYEVAAERGIVNELNGGLARAQVAAIGPVLAEALHAREIRVDICPEQGFVMKNLVQQIKRVIG